ncbi:MAG: endo-1,4-beta-xylanase [Terracidiphilus sp.]|jgi:endo-1,4-beta-xylanase
MQANSRTGARSVAAAFLIVVCGAAAAHAPTSLKQAFKGDFVIGAAMNEAQISGQDQRGDALLESQFNSISPENVLKWERIHPEPGQYNFDLADQYVAFGQKHQMFIAAHTLVWHEQVPDWVFHDDHGNLLTRDALLARMKDHIDTVVGHYRGKIQSWDVVNEALNDDGTLRQSLWYKIIGPDYIEKAFQFAHKADPQALLIYNDYSLENEPKRSGAIALIKRLQAEGIPIASVGIQGHNHLDWPTAEQEDATLSAFAAVGVKVAITEFDIDVLPSTSHQPTADVSLKIEQNAALNPYVNGLPDSVQQQLAARYADLFRVYLKHRDTVERVTFWGVTDGDSWLNGWPVKGRTSYPLLFDRNGQPKPAYDAVLHAASRSQNH